MATVAQALDRLIEEELSYDEYKKVRKLLMQAKQRVAKGLWWHFFVLLLLASEGRGQAWCTHSDVPVLLGANGWIPRARTVF